MEVLQTSNYYIFVKNEKTLWWNRTTSEFSIKAGWDLSSVDDIECLGRCDGIIGVISLPGVLDSPILLIIKESASVGAIYGAQLVYKIKSICMLSNEEPDCELTICPKHRMKNYTGTTNSSKGRLFDGSQLVNKTWGAVKIAGSTIKTTTQQAAALATNQIRSKRVAKDQRKIEKQILDEIHKIFDDSDSFYYCPDADFTNNLQRRDAQEYDDRFFWNKNMLKDVLKLNDNAWVLPVIQGFVQLEHCAIGDDHFSLALVSRRSRFRAGTRYKRRGIDENGHVANYVETEQILSFGEHQMAFFQVRGSIPVYWSQPGYKYRPPPRIDRDDNETQIAFAQHFDEELKIYKSICIINLVEQSGKEKIMFDAYGNHVVKYNNDHLIYVTFDFHEYCRGMRFENVSSLIEALAPEAVKMSFHWRDAKGPICNQNGVFRVNCMDCLDRTNVVQTAMGRAVMESQLVKVGLMPPYSQVPDQLKIPFMLLWANNGDIISRQYAGTNALKGDYTRTGERNLAGLVKDGMNSANRYIIQNFYDTFRQSMIDLMQGNITRRDELQFNETLKVLASIAESPIEMSNFYHYGALNNELQLTESILKSTSYYLARFKDSFRQDTIDVMLGNPVSTESLLNMDTQNLIEEDVTEASEACDHARQLVEDCRRMLLGLTELPMGSWGLINADPMYDTGDVNETEVDTILLLTAECYLIAEYDSNMDKVVRFEKVALENITEIELGWYQHSKIFQITPTPNFCLRISYSVDGIDQFYHMLRSASLRFFNTVAVVIKTQEEIIESLAAIVDCFRMALENCGNDHVKFTSGGQIKRRKSRTHTLDIPNGMQRNLSESQLVQAGSKAVSNVAEQFSKLGHTFNPKILTGKKNIPASNSTVSSADEVSAAKYTVQVVHDDSICSNAENSVIDSTIVCESSSKYNDNSFLQSVGIVMVDAAEMAETQNQSEIRKPSNNKNLENVARISISSVTDNVKLPPEMLEIKDISDKSPATPEINVQETDDKYEKNNGLKMCHSFADMRSSDSTFGEDLSSGLSANRDLKLHLPNSQSENAIKQLKTLTSPLSKFAANLGSALDPRKYGSKTSISETQPDPLEKEKLQEKWEASNCKTKLIAL
ncbi:phosphatidylinositide phosphatase SAC2 isoform X1 [Sitodiplosis mosellana]|uniref:phosphatidylinositide phosphatase SAC2 isoform X1 n=1 Tax=Sitodiplosis mosellana TaxID=263140 RepID=UPI00244420D1|nr:phosphatidylinositide phosphatase SAC2 isoform X1 [Sitodiplosis mosellana]XP_055315657.1 phosphatidylinositide phosphatase SAC2 isoform X1 [Sitodiplosis mosellana]